MTTPPVAEPRTAGRMFILDDDDRLLLVHERRDLDSNETIWLTPGGGVEDGESLLDGARREVMEETGLAPRLVSTEPVFVERVEFGLAGRRYDQTNHYFLARVPSGAVVEPAGHTEIERQVVLGHRWWPLDELAASTELREPATMVDVVRRAAEKGSQ